MVCVHKMYVSLSSTVVSRVLKLQQRTWTAGCVPELLDIISVMLILTLCNCIKELLKHLRGGRQFVMYRVFQMFLKLRNTA